MMDKQIAQRKVALWLYEKEIDELYSRFGNIGSGRDLSKR
jgi:hypothetical protein